MNANLEQFLELCNYFGTDESTPTCCEIENIMKMISPDIISEWYTIKIKSKAMAPNGSEYCYYQVTDKISHHCRSLGIKDDRMPIRVIKWLPHPTSLESRIALFSFQKDNEESGHYHRLDLADLDPRPLEKLK